MISFEKINYIGLKLNLYKLELPGESLEFMRLYEHTGYLTVSQSI